MHCGQCGAQIQEGQNFCNRCGRPVSAGATLGANAAAAAPPPPMGPAGPVSPGPTNLPVGAGRSRISCHLRTLGILWIVVSMFRLLPALGMLFFGRMGFPFMPPHLRFFMAPFLGGLGTFLSLTAAAGLAAGWGLLERRPWGRMLAIVLGCLSLISFPFGTALGIYTLWVLVPEGAEAEYQRIARAN
ncbi:MAG TPA: zinc ribbon domain-containing protein [Terriglobia bacterium]